MPVQRATMSAMSSSVTSSLSNEPSLCNSASFSFSTFSCFSSSPSLPYLNSAALFRSLSRSAFSAACRVSSICSFTARICLILSFSTCQRALRCEFFSFKSPSSFLRFSSLSFDAASFSFLNATCSISSCFERRSISSISSGMESISVRNFAPASSIKSMALSGKKRSEI